MLLFLKTLGTKLSLIHSKFRCQTSEPVRNWRDINPSIKRNNTNSITKRKQDSDNQSINRSVNGFVKFQSSCNDGRRKRRRRRANNPSAAEKGVWFENMAGGFGVRWVEAGGGWKALHHAADWLASAWFARARSFAVLSVFDSGKRARHCHQYRAHQGHCHRQGSFHA